MQKITLFNIFKAFFKVGLILLGGGYVILPILNNEIVKKRNWITTEELFDYYCIAQCLPGIIAINTSILVAYRLLKFKGVLSAIFGISLSPIITIIIIANLMNKITNLPFLESVFFGVNISIIVLIYLTVKEMWKKSIYNLLTIFWFCFILILSLLKINPSYLIIISILFGIIIQFLKETKEKKNV